MCLPFPYIRRAASRRALVARMLLTSEDYREMTRTVREAYERLCDGCLVMVQEGGYSEAYVPFCGHTVVEKLSSMRTAIEDPRLYFLRQQQASAELRHFQRGRLEQLAAQLRD